MEQRWWRHFGFLRFYSFNRPDMFHPQHVEEAVLLRKVCTPDSPRLRLYSAQTCLCAGPFKVAVNLTSRNAVAVGVSEADSASSSPSPLER